MRRQVLQRPLWVRVSLGSQVRRKVLQRKVRWFYSGCSVRPSMINDRLKISELIMKGSLSQNKKSNLDFHSYGGLPGVRLAGCRGTLGPQWFALLAVLRRWSRVGLALCCFVVYSARRFVLSYLVSFCSCVFQSF